MSSRNWTCFSFFIGLVLAGCGPHLETHYRGGNASDEAQIRAQAACTSAVDNDDNSGVPRGLPNGLDILRRVDAENPGLLQQSCRDQGGNNEFLFKAVEALRRSDPRWGLNWKRGNIGDMSQDVVTYYRGRGPFTNGTDQYVVDIIGGHCGSNPSLVWNDVTCYGASCPANGSRWTVEPMPKCGGNPGPGPTPTPTTPPSVGCNASGSIVNNGYESKNICEHTWGFTLTCNQQQSGCWKPGTPNPGPTPTPTPTPTPSPTQTPPPATCNASGSIVNNGYETKNYCEHTWNWTLTCVQVTNGCWKPAGGATGCNASGSIVNGGYVSKDDCEHTWGYTLTCGQAENGCWRPPGR